MHADMTHLRAQECVLFTIAKHVRHVTCWTTLASACACGPVEEEVALHTGFFDTW